MLASSPKGGGKIREGQVISKGIGPGSLLISRREKKRHRKGNYRWGGNLVYRCEGGGSHRGETRKGNYAEARTK